MALKYQTEAIVLSVRDIGSTDRMLTIFSKEYGKITAMAYGVRNSKTRQSGSLQPFAHLDISISKTKGIDTAEQWATKNSFRPLREDLTIMSYASFLSELVNELWPEKETDSRIFDLLLKFFHLLSSRNSRIAALAGAFKLISLAGFHPNYDTCTHCGRNIDSDAYFDILAGGSMCSCCQKNSLPRPEAKIADLTESMRRFLYHMENIFLENTSPPCFSVNPKTLAQTECLILDYINCHLDLGRELKSVSFIRKINSFT